ncbi:MAG: hypothetical protein FJX74_20905, partial [Armatimonadetes bacterium]|nr:hypothetical protein [Armatimonadota bacterium]
EAFDGLEMAGGLPTTAKDGPIVGNRDPVLDWTGLQGFETDGVDPDVGSAMQTFRFKVRYQDADNDWPAQVLLHIARAGTEIAGSPVDLSRVPGAKPRQGVVYRGETVLGRGKNYTHWFEANDGFGPAVGPATAPQAGPVVNSPPYLEWVSTDPWEGDGVTPDTGTGRTRCVFRVVYRDLDNDAPTQVLLELRRYRTVADPRSPLAMVQFRGGTARDGLTFRRALWLNPGVYWYRFVASDGFSAAQGVPTQWTRGPVIDSGAAAAQITSATAVATGRGAQITFSLSTPATVRAEVLNVAGRPVRTLAPKDCDAGSRTLLWDGMSAAGLPVPDGLYLISLTARDAGGGEARALSRVYLRR